MKITIHCEQINVYHDFVNEGKKSREYHIGTHPVFEKIRWFQKMSMKCETSAQFLMLVCQDKSYFKQYSFSEKCWIDPLGEMKLLPKIDGYTWIVPVFVWRDFGAGLVVSDEDLHLSN